MDVLFLTLLIAHIAAGTLSLIVAPAAMATKKGKRWHRRWGKLYFWGMFAVAVTAVAMSLIKLNLFLLLLAVFSFYLSFVGYRAIYQKRPGTPATRLDWSVTLGTLAASAGLVGWGGSVVAAGSTFGIVSAVFGAVGALMAAADIRRYLRPVTSDSKAWLLRHVRGFGASYIATVSAFSAVNLHFLPDVVQWLWPSVIGTVMIRMAVTRIQTGRPPRRANKRASEQPAQPRAWAKRPAERIALP